MLELLKLLVQPVLLERDENGVVIGERLLPPQPVYFQEQLNDLIAEVRAQVLQLEMEPSNGDKASV